jgi:CelD/BcsL family acetyltransferase involved in cellulose biosynthesis
MTTAEVEISEYAPRPLRYRLGGILFGEWWPRLAIATPAASITGGDAGLRQALPRALPAAADGILLRNVAADAFPVGMRRLGPYLEYVPRHDVLYLVDIAGSFADYLGRNFSAKSRQNLNRAVRRIQALADTQPSWQVYTDEAQMAEFLREAAALSAKTYQSRLLKVGLQDDADTLKDFTEAARQGRGRGYLLRIKGQTIAFAWCRATHRRLVYDTIGYSTEHAALSPGNVLLYCILQDLFALGRYDCLDFGPGEAAYKSLFSTRKAMFVDAYFLRADPFTTLRVATHWGVYRSSVWLSKFLERSGWKKSLKALLRRMHGVV